MMTRLRAITAAICLITGCAAGRVPLPSRQCETAAPTVAQSAAGTADFDEFSPVAALASALSGPSSAPFFRYRSHPVEYVGPGRDEPEPENVDEVRIGWFGPTDPKDPLAGLMWSAAILAVDEANRDGGYRGRPFRLIGAWSANPWGSGIKDVTRLVYDEGVWAILGGPDGPSAHLVEQVISKARLPYISPVSTDKSTNLVNVPWIFSCAPADHLLAPLLAEAIATKAGSFVLISCTDHDSRVTAAELLAAMTRLKAGPTRRLDFLPGAVDFAAQIRSVRESSPSAVVVIAGPRDSGRFLAALRREGVGLPVFGGPTMGQGAFLETAGRAAERAVFPLLWDSQHAGERAQPFVRHFRQRFATEPDYAAAYTYDAANLLIAAVRQAGLNRPRIADAVRGLSGWLGVTGAITWDPTGQNHRAVILGTIRDGRLRPVRAQQAAVLSSPSGY